MKPVKRPFEEEDEARGDEGAGKMIRREEIHCVRKEMKVFIV